MTSKEAEVSRGRAIMSAVIGSYGTTLLFTVIFGAQRFDTTKDIVTFFIQASLTAWLFYMMWTGRQWARWTISALFAVGVIIVMISSINSFNWRLGLFLAYQSSIILLLCIPSAVDSFVDDQKGKRMEPNHMPQPTSESATPAVDAGAAPIPSEADR